MPFAPQFGRPFYGNSGTSLSLGASGTFYGPQQFHDLTIPAGSILSAPTSSYGPLILHVSGTLTVAGAVSADAVGEVYYAGSWESNGGVEFGPTSGYGAMVGPGKVGSYFWPLWPVFPILGGGGGGGTGSGHAGFPSYARDYGGTGSVPTLHAYSEQDTAYGGAVGTNASDASATLTSGFDMAQLADSFHVLAAGCGGGLGGRCPAGDYGGSGGAGGGIVLIYARRVVVASTGRISASGDNGEPGPVAGTGGGGGGGGGFVSIFCDYLTNDGTIEAKGGLAGAAGDATAGHGGRGLDGIVRIWRAS